MLSGRRSKGAREGRMRERALECPLADLLWARLSLAVPYPKQRSTWSEEVAGGLLVSAYVSPPQRGMHNPLLFLEFTVCAEHCGHQCGTSSGRQDRGPSQAGRPGRREAGGSVSRAGPVGSKLPAHGPARPSLGSRPPASSPRVSLLLF